MSRSCLFFYSHAGVIVRSNKKIKKNPSNGRMEQSRVKNYGQSNDQLIDSSVEYTLCGLGYVIEAKSPTLPSALFS